MALTPSRTDRKRKKEPRRKREDPDAFNAAERPSGPARPATGGDAARYGRVKHEATLERSLETGENYKEIAHRNHR
ncbi:hypothetical protein [Thiohalorhabdus methylotrophus]|uniref:Uncharacterized protein n=1 Tax=Thiohalorhabdus methylotrophus TaxID=3242694 RepID=A0ABV4TRM3_9GAMM